MKKIPKREYTTEFEEQAVKNAQAMGFVVAAKELGLVEQTPRNWVSSADGKLTAPGAKPVTPEQMELSRLPAENARLKMHVDILRRVSPLVADFHVADRLGPSTGSVLAVPCGTVTRRSEISPVDARRPACPRGCDGTPACRS